MSSWGEIIQAKSTELTSRVRAFYSVIDSTGASLKGTKQLYWKSPLFISAIKRYVTSSSLIMQILRHQYRRDLLLWIITNFMGAIICLLMLEWPSIQINLDTFQFIGMMFVILFIYPIICAVLSTTMAINEIAGKSTGITEIPFLPVGLVLLLLYLDLTKNTQLLQLRPQAIFISEPKSF